MKILLVDDEVEYISTLSERLAMRGIEADYVTSGNAAVEAAKKTKYDVAVLDMKMAGLGGLQTMEILRKDFPDMKFLILTGHADEEDYNKGQQAGVAFYLMKPLDIEELIDKVNQALGQGSK